VIPFNLVYLLVDEERMSSSTRSAGVLGVSAFNHIEGIADEVTSLLIFLWVLADIVSSSTDLRSTWGISSIPFLEVLGMSMISSITERGRCGDIVCSPR